MLLCIFEVGRAAFAICFKHRDRFGVRIELDHIMVCLHAHQFADTFRSQVGEHVARKTHAADDVSDIQFFVESSSRLLVESVIA